MKDLDNHNKFKTFKHGKRQFDGKRNYRSGTRDYPADQCAT